MPELAAGIERADKRRAEWLQEASERLKD